MDPASIAETAERIADRTGRAWRGGGRSPSSWVETMTNDGKHRFLFHCTTTNHGAVLEVQRKVPHAPDSKEPMVPRLCVCPSIPACFSSRLFAAGQDVHVYRTPTRCKGIKPHGVWDEFITRERWLIPPCRLERSKVIPSETVERSQLAVRMFHTATRENSNVALRCAQYVRACEVLGSSANKLADLYRSYFNLGPDVDWWILSKVG